MNDTWSEKSRAMVDNLVERINNYAVANNIAYEAKPTMSGLNDRIVVAPTCDDLEAYCFISIIIGWWYADAELAVRFSCNEDTMLTFVTKDYIDVENDLSFADEERSDSEYLKNNDVKYYHPPFDEREDDIFSDVVECLKKLQNKQLC